MYSVLDVQSPELIYSDSHITLTCTFTDDSTPVDVESPEFHLYAGTVSGDPEVVSDITILKPVQKSPENQAGQYVVTFLSKALAAGTYLALFKGTVDGRELVFTSNLELKAIARVQWFIELVLGSLRGKYNLLVPNNLMTIDPRKRNWQDGEIYDCLIRAVSDFNSLPPVLDTVYDLEGFPVEANNLLVLGAQIYALFAAASLEAQNFFTVNTPINLNLFRGTEFKELMRFVRESYLIPMKEFKTQFWFNTIQEQVTVMNRVPIRIVRPISDELFMHRLSF